MVGGNFMKTIIVKDYIYEGNYIIGYLESMENGVEKYILDDGDVYPLEELKAEGYDIIFISSDEIIEAFKKRFEVI
jgi:hypothetical protein